MKGHLFERPQRHLAVENKQDAKRCSFACVGRRLWVGSAWEEEEHSL